MNTVLIVEDERAILELVAFASEASGFHALKAGSVAEAKEKLSVEKPDIIVLDWMLPDCSGLEWLVQAPGVRGLCRNSGGTPHCARNGRGSGKRPRSRGG